ncbi:hypothetical protein LEN26_009423 [Aphanomyces euteiches]|uniref:BZIP domain-containing protein n=1 Tax=Aphanomyces euteiches TaxID=100861 RepID=A0A6G0WY06_9STRA|nr:hypothetical protein Ae201684_010527 [Aphanomyces euteiches]KAH9089910.1 hypothetical protein Ae201684P_014665 [Aphanomyces euteiches]KAH9115207.1 hypothetical protein AeMF1_010754 [Aphanomyces euteiches]KAH9126097.1 hypothetical protein LEN26_009423 [Aphanomyces euteiches]KAH9155464.1 hypothetical protein AeRB84_002561 [Aphanomyces euteiches]
MDSKTQLSFILHTNDKRTSPTHREATSHERTSPKQRSDSPLSPERKSTELKLIYNRVRQRNLRHREKIERLHLERQVKDLELQLRLLQAKHRRGKIREMLLERQNSPLRMPEVLPPLTETESSAQ